MSRRGFGVSPTLLTPFSRYWPLYIFSNPAFPVHLSVYLFCQPRRTETGTELPKRLELAGWRIIRWIHHLQVDQHLFLYYFIFSFYIAALLPSSPLMHAPLPVWLPLSAAPRWAQMTVRPHEILSHVQIAFLHSVDALVAHSIKQDWHARGSATLLKLNGQIAQHVPPGNNNHVYVLIIC